MDIQVKFLTDVGIKALNLTSASEEEKTNAGINNLMQML